MPQATAEADANRGRAPEYPSTAGAKTSTDAHPVTETGTEARAGVTGHGVNVVLVTSLAAVILAFVVIYVAFFAH
jgi:hypothetical protein